MALFIPKKRMGAPTTSPTEKSRLQAPMEPNRDDDDIDFGFEETGGGYDYYEDDGPLYEPTPDEECFEYSPADKPVSADTPLNAPLRRRVARAVPEESTTVIEPEVRPPGVDANVSDGERSHLSSHLSRALHRRLKVFSILSGKSIASILESWIDQHCPPL